MRQAFAACMAFVVLVVVVAIRFGSRDTRSEAPAREIADAGVGDAPVDGVAVALDAAATPKKRAPKPTPSRTTLKPTPKPTPVSRSQPSPTPVGPRPVVPTPIVPAPVSPTPGRPQCTQAPNPAGCPAKEPNVNRPCDADGVHCVYGTSCCPIVYVCTSGAFEAWFTSCP